MKTTVRKQLITQGYIDRFWENLVKVGKERITLHYLKTRLELLESYWRRFEEGHYELIEQDDDAAVKYLRGDTYTLTEDKYVNVKTKIVSLLKDDTFSSKEGASTSKQDSSAHFLRQIQLPKISLPTFPETN